MRPIIFTACISVLAIAGCTDERDAPGAGDGAQTGTPAGASATAESAAATATVAAAGLCVDAGPQTPRDISSGQGRNPNKFALAPQPAAMNLCNIHTHTNAEHKGPGFSVFVNDTDSGGYACNDAGSLTEAELTDPAAGNGAYQGVAPGDTIEVHWVYSTCDVQPGAGLGSCLSDTCTDPLLRVEAQVFLVANDPDAIDFTDYVYDGNTGGGFHQPKALPEGTGEPVVFRGSTTGPSYDQSDCSPMQVTWSVRPQCARVDIGSLHRWAENGNVFEETKSHGVRQLVTAPELLSEIE